MEPRHVQDFRGFCYPFAIHTHAHTRKDSGLMAAFVDDAPSTSAYRRGLKKKKKVNDTFCFLQLERVFTTILVIKKNQVQNRN